MGLIMQELHWNLAWISSISLSRKCGAKAIRFEEEATKFFAGKLHAIPSGKGECTIGKQKTTKI